MDHLTEVKFMLKFYCLTMLVKNILINCVESQYTQEYIANVFWRQNIAKVGAITLIPYLKNCEVYNIAYITIDEWCDSEVAYNFIQRLNDNSKEVHIIHHTDDWWLVEINTHNNGDIYLENYTVTFMSDYFVRNEEIEEMEDIEDIEDNIYSSLSVEDDDLVFSDSECNAFLQEITIKGIDNEHHRIEDVESHIKSLKFDLESEYREQLSDEYLDELEKELEYFETELRIHKSINNSEHVTLRNKDKNVYKPIWPLIYPEANVVQ